MYDEQILLPVRGSRPGKTVQLTEGEIRGLCLKSREIFLSQPILLELEAPLKICGAYKYSGFLFLMELGYSDGTLTRVYDFGPATSSKQVP